MVYVTGTMVATIAVGVLAVGLALFALFDSPSPQSYNHRRRRTPSPVRRRYSPPRARKRSPSPPRQSFTKHSPLPPRQSVTERSPLPPCQSITEYSALPPRRRIKKRLPFRSITQHSPPASISTSGSGNKIKDQSHLPSQNNLSAVASDPSPPKCNLETVASSSPVTKSDSVITDASNSTISEPDPVTPTLTSLTDDVSNSVASKPEAAALTSVSLSDDVLNSAISKVAVSPTDKASDSIISKSVASTSDSTIFKPDATTSNLHMPMTDSTISNLAKHEPNDVVPTSGSIIGSAGLERPDSASSNSSVSLSGWSVASEKEFSNCLVADCCFICDDAAAGLVRFTPCGGTYFCKQHAFNCLSIGDYCCKCGKEVTGIALKTK